MQYPVQQRPVPARTSVSVVARSPSDRRVLATLAGPHSEGLRLPRDVALEGGGDRQLPRALKSFRCTQHGRLNGCGRNFLGAEEDGGAEQNQPRPVQRSKNAALENPTTIPR